VLLDPHQRVETHCVRRHEFIEFDDRLHGLSACGEQLWDLRLTQVSRQMHHHTTTLTSELYPAPHVRQNSKGRTATLSKGFAEITPLSHRRW
jgi:hypothetical protein